MFRAKEVPQNKNYTSSWNSWALVFFGGERLCSFMPSGPLLAPQIFSHEVPAKLEILGQRVLLPSGSLSEYNKCLEQDDLVALWGAIRSSSMTMALISPVSWSLDSCLLIEKIIFKSRKLPCPSITHLWGQLTSNFWLMMGLCIAV